jgi:hypothetical protein
MVEELKSLNVNTLTPLEALNRLADFQRRAGQRLNQAQLHADEH